jgi:hypothetical protein
VGRFACDWLRLATTDPDAIHLHSVRLDAGYVSGSVIVVSGPVFVQMGRCSSRWAGVRPDGPVFVQMGG